MSGVMIEQRSIVVPGDVLAEGMDYLPGHGTYRLENKIIAEKYGMLSVEGRALKIIPLSGRYNPKANDVIIGTVIDVTIGGWRFETNSAYSAMLSVKEATSEYIERGANLTNYFDVGDYVVAKVTNVTSQKLVDLSTKGPGLRKLIGGRILEVNCHKVPRIIGKKGSMISLVKNATGCIITVGQNGLIWIKGEPKKELLAVQTIKMIEENSHTSGLTDSIKEFLDKQNK